MLYALVRDFVSEYPPRPGQGAECVACKLPVINFEQPWNIVPKLLRVALLVLLAAIDEGLGAGVYGVFPEEAGKLRVLLQIPEDFAIVAGVTLGLPLPDPEWSKRSSRSTQRRRTLDELVGWNRWSS